jgi:ADP-heptose:LPS heptosyltransferase
MENKHLISNGLEWINPAGGYGDMILLSGALKLVHDKYPDRRYNLVRRTAYQFIFENHPAIAEVGHPPEGAVIHTVGQWHTEPVTQGDGRPFQVLARQFGLETPVEESLWLPDVPVDVTVLEKALPWTRTNVLISPLSNSPRKSVSYDLWTELVIKFHEMDAFVAQVGRLWEPCVPGAYSLMGCTTPKQFLSILPRFDLIVTLDSFISHAAKAVGSRCVAIWGATHHSIFGYPDDHFNIQSNPMCTQEVENSCYAPRDPSMASMARIYTTPCPMEEHHCTNQVSMEVLWETILKALESPHPRDRQPVDSKEQD